MESISVKRAWEIIGKNKAGEKPLSLDDDHTQKKQSPTVDLLAGESITRFDRSKKKKKKKSPKNPRNPEKPRTQTASQKTQ